VGKKVISGLTGLGLVLFIVVHLAGNLLLFMGGEPFNSYAHFLETVGHGALLPIAEISLLLLFMLHIGSGFTVFNDKTRARPVGYVKVASAGHTSRRTASSNSMIVSGVLLLFFVVLHILQFRFGPGSGPEVLDEYHTQIAGETVRNLYKLVFSTFHEPTWVVVYVVAMILLGLHLRHGFWSMFQSMGWSNKRILPIIYPAGIVVAIVLAIGFICLPIYIMSQPVPEHAQAQVQVINGGQIP
jgi:succinate dehydrogenase / fumarate reductase cytochrome b subunit